MLKVFLMLALVAGCGRDDCAVNTPCSATSNNHYQFCNGGSADDCYYVTQDGHKFHCLTCGDCSDAKSLVTTWCAAQPNRTTGGGGDNTNGQTCQTGACPVGGRSYTFCTTPTASSCSYRGSDGSVFSCNSCSDCSAAAQKLTNWCTGTTTSSGGSTTGGTTSDASCFAQTSAACQTCCATNHKDGANYFADAYVTCGCAFCGSACNVNGDVCHGGSTQTAPCATCLDDAFQSQCSTQLANSCAANSACSSYLACVTNC